VRVRIPPRLLPAYLSLNKGGEKKTKQKAELLQVAG